MVEKKEEVGNKEMKAIMRLVTRHYCRMGFSQMSRLRHDSHSWVASVSQSHDLGTDVRPFLSAAKQTTTPATRHTEEKSRRNSTTNDDEW
jgi:hypothetical protein